LRFALYISPFVFESIVDVVEAGLDPPLHTFKLIGGHGVAREEFWDEQGRVGLGPP
jgi:hypothetical protein